MTALFLQAAQTEPSCPHDQNDTNNVGSNSWPEMLLFQTSPGPLSIQQCHPSPTGVFRLWQAFVDNVDPLVKIIHTPTVQSRLVQASLEADTIEPSFEALMFAIYYAATISSQPGGPNIVERNRARDLNTYRWALNQALCRAGFFQRSRDIVSLQAFVIYLVRFHCRTSASGSVESNTDTSVP